MNTFEAVLLAVAFATALVNWWRLTEAKDEIAQLRATVNYNKRTSDMRYNELKGGYTSEYEEIAKIYEEEGNNELHA